MRLISDDKVTTFFNTLQTDWLLFGNNIEVDPNIKKRADTPSWCQPSLPVIGW